MTIRESLKNLFEEKWELDKELAGGWSTFTCYSCGQGHDEEQVINDLESLFNKLLSEKVQEIEKLKRKAEYINGKWYPTSPNDPGYNEGVNDALLILQPTTQEEKV